MNNRIMTERLCAIIKTTVRTKNNFIDVKGRTNEDIYVHIWLDIRPPGLLGIMQILPRTPSEMVEAVVM